MKMSVKKALADLYTSVMSRPALQPFNGAILKFTLYAMGIGYSEHSGRNGERRWLNELRQRLSTDGEDRYVIFDVGANVGDYAREVAGVFGGSAVIHAFEPSRATFERLCRSTADIDGIVCNNLGVGGTASTATLYTDSEGSTLASLYPRDLERFDRSMDRSESIELVSVDDYCRQKGIERIDLLKLDIEGNEYEALRGAEGMIRDRRIRFIQFEFGVTTLAARVSFHDFWQLLSSSFDIYRILRHGLQPVRRYEECCEIFMYQNFVAVARADRR